MDLMLRFCTPNAGGAAAMQGIAPSADAQYNGVPLDVPPSVRQGFGRADLSRALPLAGSAPGWNLQVRHKYPDDSQGSVAGLKRRGVGPRVAFDSAGCGLQAHLLTSSTLLQMVQELVSLRNGRGEEQQPACTLSMKSRWEPFLGLVLCPHAAWVTSTSDVLHWLTCRWWTEQC